ncbi:MAG TPA: nitroreductase, partial [Polyangiaceae bacterium]|nr:nitroreductase [Polyangiaceae bacterium]
ALQVSADPRLNFLTGRSSALALTEPAPSDATLDQLLAAATAVPDHAGLRPFRFVIVQGEARERFGQALAAVAEEQEGTLSEFARNKLVQKAYFAPCLVALVSSPRVGVKVPTWEQEASAACTGFALVLAAEAVGLGAVWKSAPVHEGRALTELLGLAEQERFLGWVNLGTHGRPTRPRAPEDLSRLVTRL